MEMVAIQMNGRENMRKVVGITFTLVLGLMFAAPAWSQEKNLWIAKFNCDANAAAAVASIQQSDQSTLQYSNLFKNISSFSSDSKQPAGSWSLSATEVSYSGGVPQNV